MDDNRYIYICMETLNDDCLQLICEYLTPHALIAMTMVNRRLRMIAKCAKLRTSEYIVVRTTATSPKPPGAFINARMYYKDCKVEEGAIGIELRQDAMKGAEDLNEAIMASLTNFANCDNLETASLANITKAIDCVQLSSAKKLRFDNCDIIENFEHLESANYVELLNMTRDFDFTPFQSMTRLMLRKCTGAITIPPINNIRGLILEDEIGDIDLSAFTNVRKLIVSRTFVDFQQFTKLADVTISCSGISDIRGLEGVKDVQILNCRNVTDVSPLAHSEHVKLICCHCVTDVSTLATVKDLILQSMSIRDISMLSNVPSLKVVSCRYVTSIQRVTDCVTGVVEPRLIP